MWNYCVCRAAIRVLYNTKGAHQGCLRCQGRHQMGSQLNYIQLAALLKFSLLLVSIIKLAVWLHLDVPVNSVAAHSCCCLAGQSGFSLFCDMAVSLGWHLGTRNLIWLDALCVAGRLWNKVLHISRNGCGTS